MLRLRQQTAIVRVATAIMPGKHRDTLMPQLPHMRPGAAAIYLMLGWPGGRFRAIDVTPGSALQSVCSALTAARQAEQDAERRIAEHAMRNLDLQAAWDAQRHPEVDLPDDEPDDRCTHPNGHEWSFTGTAYGGDDDRWHGEGRCFCAHCGADGDA